MCSIYELSSTPSGLIKDLGFKNISENFTLGRVRPNDAALTIINEKAIIINWGLTVTWNKKLLINARYETLEKTRTFYPLLKNRCLIPATAYFEWRHIKHKKLKNRIEILNTNIMTFAGLYSGESFVIITCPSVDNISHIHQRMPLIVAPHERMNWLEASRSPVEIFESLNSTFCANLIYSEEKHIVDQFELFDS
ncbi:MAG: hypothetical protein CMF69_10780 [Magnetovibrio sp.]|nr:hypothetical protein [Magnetovibrio sp.]|tara:strand:+ start:586 stop:1170 length:585 start_codon:yes stop_codon:yes gene_type:complete